MAITKDILDELLKGYKGPDDINGPDGLLKQLTKTVIVQGHDIPPVLAA